MKLSIIICVYNTDKDYFDACLKSLTRSTLASTAICGRRDISYEIVVVDDGSTVDYSDTISHYPSITYVKTENRGIFKARALGVELASGDYIAFCDSDDTVSYNYHLPMLLAAERRGADIVMNDWAFHSQNARYCCRGDSTISTDIEKTGEDVLYAFVAQRGREHSYYVLWNKIYSAAILKEATKTAIAAAEEKCGEARYNYSEDALINFFAFKGAKKLVNIHTGYYFYRVHGSQTVNVTSKERLLTHVNFTTTTLSVMRDGVKGYRAEGEMLEHLHEWALLMSRTHYSYAKKGGYTDLFEVIREGYGADKLRTSTMHDGSAYSKNKLLADNFEAVDNALLELWRDEKKTVCIEKRSDYVARSLSFTESEQNVRLTVTKQEAAHVIPAEIIPIKKRIIYNPIVYKLGMLLFKKGSKIRAFLKKSL